MTEGKTISGQRNGDIRPQYPREYKIQRDSILKIGMKFSKKKTSGKRQISGRESHRWCFVTEFREFILWETKLSQVSVLNTKEADVAHLRSRSEISRCGES